jgi:YVTN family beta-propeller protein
MLAHPRWRAGLLTAAAVLLAGPGLACSSARTPAPGAGSGSRPGSSPGFSPTSSTSRTDGPSASGAGERPTSLSYLEQIGGLGRPCAVLGAAGSVWVADFSSGRVDRLDPATGRVTGHATAGVQPCGMAWGAGSVWVENYGSNTVTRITPGTLAARSYAVGAAPYDVTFAAGAAWATNWADGTVTRVSAATGKTRTITVGSSPEGIAPAGGAVWVANTASGTVSRIDIRTLKVTTLRTGGKPAWTAYHGGTVWVGDQAAGTVLTISAATGKITGRARVGAQPNDGDVLGGAAWFPDAHGSLYRVSADGRTVAGPWKLPAANPFTLAAYDGRLWVANFGGTNVLVVNPARLPGG